MTSEIMERWNSQIPMKLITKTQFVDVKTPVQKVLQLLSEYSAVIINKNQKYYGVVDSRSIQRSRVALELPRGQSIERFVDHVTPINSKVEFQELIQSFLKTRGKAIPVLLNGKIVGLLDRVTVLKMLLSFRMLGDIKIRDIMASPLIAIDSNATLAQAKAVMEYNNVNRVVVIKDKKMHGLLTYFRLVKDFSNTNERLPEMKTKVYAPSQIIVSDIVEHSPKTIRADKDVASAVRLLLEENISSLVVVNDKELPVGMISSTDIFDGVLAKKRLEDNRIFISGLDVNTKEFEDEIRSEITSFIAKIEQMRAERVEYVNMHIKRIKNKTYDIQMRVSMKNGGVVSAHITDFLLERTLKEAIDVLRHSIIKQKERNIAIKKGASKGDM